MELPPGVTEKQLVAWLEWASREGRHVLGHGYQAAAYLYEECDPPLVLKTCWGRGLTRMLRRRMLAREWRAYQRLRDVTSIPKGYGMLSGEHLVIEYVEGVPFRHAQIEDRERFFQRLVALVEQLHERGVAHCDLKKKENVLVRADGEPCFLDFGAAICRKRGVAPINHQLFRIGQILDRNACLKLYYGVPLSRLSREQLAGFQRTRLEKLTRWVRYRRSDYRRFVARHRERKNH